MMILAAVAAGCSPVPEPGQYGYTNQSKMQAVHHWEVLADDVAMRIKARMDELYGTGKYTRPFYVQASEVRTPFNEGFRDLLISGMMKAGLYMVANPGDGARVVNYEVKAVEHKAGRENGGRSETVVGQVLREGITVVRDTLTLGVMNASNVPHSEVMITVSIVDNNEYLLHQTDIYYVNDLDAGHYGGTGPVVKKMPVVGD